MPRALPIIGAVVGTIVNIYAPGAGFYIYAATAVVSGIVNAQEQRRLQRRAIEAGRRDNLTMVRSAEEPHRVVYGRARVSGPIAFTHSTGTENANLYLIVCLTGHEVDAFEEIVFNETKLGVTGGGVLIGSSFFSATLIVNRPALIDQTPKETGEITNDPTPFYTLDATLSFTLPVTGQLAYVTAVYSRQNEFPFVGFQSLTFTVNVNVVTVTQAGVAAGFEVYVDWAEWQGSPLVDVASYLGTETQAADADLMGASSGRWTAAHQLKGRAYIRARLVWNLDRFLAGVPNIGARLRGRKVLDPRSPTDGENWSNNSALCIRDFLTNAQFGLECDDSEIDDDSFVESANICDEFITVDTNTISDPTERANWLALLYQAQIDGTWEATLEGENFDFVANIGTLTAHNGGSLAADTTHTTFNDDVLVVGNTSGSFSEYVNMPTLGGIDDGSITLHCGYPSALAAVGFTFRTTAIGANDVYDGYRLDLNGTGNTVRLFRCNAGSLTLLGSAGIVDPGGSPPLPGVTVQCTFNGPNFEVFYQGVSKFTASDSAHASGVVRLLAFRNPPLAQMFFFDLVTEGVATVFRQRRYTCNGVFTVDRTPEDILSAMLSSCAGQLSYTGGVFRLVVGAYQTPTLTLTQDDLRGPISILPKKPRRDLFNAVRGLYAGKGTFDQPTDFPPVTNSTYETQDGGERITTDLQFEFTNDGIAAQRIAKIHLEKERQGIVFNAPCKLGAAITLRPGDTVMWTLPRMGWSSKVFRVEVWSMRCDEDYGIDLVLQEESSANYDWNLGNATVDDPAPDTTLGLSLPQPQSEVAISIMQQEEIEEELIL